MTWVCVVQWLTIAISAVNVLLVVFNLGKSRGWRAGFKDGCGLADQFFLDVHKMLRDHGFKVPHRQSPPPS